MSKILKMLNKKVRKNNKGFTLVELLVVIAIIGILGAVAVPGVVKNIEKSKAAKVQTDYQAVKTAAIAYYADNPTITSVDTDTVKTYMDKFPSPTGYDATMTLEDGVLKIADTKEDIVKIAKALGITAAADATEISITIIQN